MSPGFKPLTAGSMTVLLAGFLMLAGCAGVTQGPLPQPAPSTTAPDQSLPPETETVPAEVPPETPEAAVSEPVEVPPEAPNPRALASLELSTQARNLIAEGRLDEAIRILERSINLYPGSGESYYYLAEAWRLKGNADQAAEYNTLAAIRFKGISEWMRKVDVQKNRIEKSR